jgi:peptide/nickel transport system permease protein
MSSTSSPVATEAAPIAVGLPRRRLRHRLRLAPAAWAGTAVLALLLLAALLAPLLAPFDPDAVDPSSALQAPGPEHWLGTDNFGRDVLSRVLYGGRISLLMGLVAVSIGAVAGVTLGLLAGFFGRWTDGVLSWFAEVLLAFPGILLALVVVTVLGLGLFNAMLAVGIGFIPSFLRVTRGSVLSARAREYVAAAETVGVPVPRLLLRHILPNIGRPLLVLATIGAGAAILEGAALSFLGLGVQPPTAEWGAMLAAGQPYLRSAWWIALFPGLAIFLTVLSINLIGDGLEG